MSLSDLQPLIDDVDSIQSDTRSIYQKTRYLQGTLDSLNQTATTQSEYQRALLLFLGGGVFPPTGYTPISTLLQEIATNTRTAGNAVDVLAGNPWWSTNSAFALTKYQYSLAYPNESPNNSYSFSFPQWASKLTGMLSNNRIGSSEYVSKDVLRAQWVNTFGIDAIRNGGSISQNVNPYTWFDWMVDATKSNWVIQAGSFASSYRTLTNDVAAAGFTEDHTVTNAALPQHVNVISETQSDTSAGQASAAAGGQVLSAKVEQLQDMLDGQKDSWITVIPEFDVGGIHVRRYEANMNTSITQACHSVMVFLWYVILFASLFNLAQTELAFYLNLGRNWTMSGGVLHGK